MSTRAKAQNVETIYYDSDDQIVKVKELADYYRIIESGNTFPKMFRDYYSNGETFSALHVTKIPPTESLW